MKSGRLVMRAMHGAALWLLLALTGCGGASSGGAPAGGGVAGGVTPHATAGKAAKATPTPVKMLDWRAVALPQGAASAMIAVSTVNGREAWVCAPAGGGLYQIWRTQDEGATWNQVSALHPITQLPVNDCVVEADKGDADALLAEFNWGVTNSPVSNPPQGEVEYFTADGGATWTQAPNNTMFQEVTTVSGVTRALAMDLSKPNAPAAIIVSSDHLAAINPLPNPNGTSNANVEVWLARTPQEMIWAEMNSAIAFHSSDGGATWTAIPPPSNFNGSLTVAAWRGQATGWLICGYQNIPAASGPPTAHNECSADLGKTWTSFPTLTNTWECGHCGQNATPMSGVESCLPAMITSAGALYAMCGDDPQDTAGTTPPTPAILSTLAPGATTWTALGGAPCMFGANLVMTQTGQM